MLKLIQNQILFWRQNSKSFCPLVQLCTFSKIPAYPLIVYLVLKEAFYEGEIAKNREKKVVGNWGIGYAETGKPFEKKKRSACASLGSNKLSFVEPGNL